MLDSTVAEEARTGARLRPATLGLLLAIAVVAVTVGRLLEEAGDFLAWSEIVSWGSYMAMGGAVLLLLLPEPQ